MKQEQLKIGLPSDLRQKLDADVAKSNADFGRPLFSLGSLIRSRLERSFRDDDLRKKTHGIGHVAAELAEGLERATGMSWCGHPNAAAALIEAFKVYVFETQARLTPGDVSGDEGSQSISYPEDFDYDPETTGKLLARGYLQRMEEERELLDQLNAEDEEYDAAKRGPK